MAYGYNRSSCIAEPLPRIRVVEIPKAYFDRAPEYRGYFSLITGGRRDCGCNDGFATERFSFERQDLLGEFFNSTPMILSVCIFGSLDLFDECGTSAQMYNGTTFNYFMDSTNKRFGITVNANIVERFNSAFAFRLENGRTFWELSEKVCGVRIAYLIP